jgi:hypothetical protein
VHRVRRAPRHQRHAARPRVQAARPRRLAGATGPLRPPELLSNAPLAGHGLRIDRAVVSEPFGLIPYDALYRWRGRPSPCARYDDPGLLEHRGLACTWRADCTVVRSGGAWRWGDAEREAFVEVHTGSARCSPPRWSAGGTTTSRCSATSLPGSPTARSSPTRPSGAPPACRPAAVSAGGCCGYGRRRPGPRRGHAGAGRPRAGRAPPLPGRPPPGRRAHPGLVPAPAAGPPQPARRRRHEHAPVSTPREGPAGRSGAGPRHSAGLSG